MPPYSSLLSWRILCTEEPGGLQSTGSQSQATERLSSRHDKVSATECFQLHTVAAHYTQVNKHMCFCRWNFQALSCCCRTAMPETPLICFLETAVGASLVAQWSRIHLPMQKTWVPPPVWKDSTFCRATKPVHHNF